MENVRYKVWGVAVSFWVLGILLGITGIYIGEVDDAPGAALIGGILMAGCIVFGIRTIRRKR